MIAEQPGKDEIPSWAGIEKKYAGNPWLSVNTICFLSITLLFLLIIWASRDTEIVPLAICSAFIIVMSYMHFAIQMNYFIVKDEILIIKNHYSRSDNISIPLIDITGFEIINPPKLSKALKIFTSHGNAETFMAGGLNKKNWSEFKEDMTKAGFTIKEGGNFFDSIP